MNIQLNNDSGMPQSFHYQNKDHEVKDAKEWMKNIAVQVKTEKIKERIILTWRQPDSYESGSILYPLADNRLVPDVAFMIGPLNETDAWTKKEKEQVDFLFLLRSDKESPHFSKRNVEILRKILDNNTRTKDLTFDVVDWWDRSRFYENTTGNMPGPQFKYKVNKLNSSDLF